MLLKDGYRTFYRIVFFEVSKLYGIIPNELKIKKAACVGNISRNFCCFLETGNDKSRGSTDEI